MRFLAKKMREYREIAPENDPCMHKFGVSCLLAGLKYATDCLNVSFF